MLCDADTAHDYDVDDNGGGAEDDDDEEDRWVRRISFLQSIIAKTRSRLYERFFVLPFRLFFLSYCPINQKTFHFQFGSGEPVDFCCCSFTDLKNLKVQ